MEEVFRHAFPLLFGLFIVLMIWRGMRRDSEASERSSPPRRAPGRPPSRGALKFMASGRSGELSDDGDGFLTVTIDLRGLSPGTLKIFPVWMGTTVGHRFGDQDLRVGDREFDREYVVKANPESLVTRLFGPEQRAAVVAAVRRCSARRDFVIDLSREALRVRAPGDAKAFNVEFHPLVAAARELAAFVRNLQEGGGILWIGEPGAPGGQCQVCGSEMRDGVVQCAKCRTPHHEECWRYTGICSTYGCKETRYLVDGWKIQAPPPRRQKPSGWLEEETARDRRETGGRVTEQQVWRTVEAAQREMQRFEQRQRERGG